MDHDLKRTHPHKSFVRRCYALALGGLLCLGCRLLVAQAADPVRVPYTSIQGAHLDLYAWPGIDTALLTESADLDPVTITKILAATDFAYRYYALAVGARPKPQLTYKGLDTIAEVRDTCGAGCTYIGSTGAELIPRYFDILYQGVHTSDTYDQVVFYELGRSFWFLGPQLTYKQPSGSCIVTGFAVLMRYALLSRSGLTGAFEGSPTLYNSMLQRTETLVDKYLADPANTWQTTLQAGRSPDLNCTDLFASFVLRLMRDNGGDRFLMNLWRQAAHRPAAATTQDAVDNFILAACAAANRNLTGLFVDTWRWPISSKARSEAHHRWP